MRIPPEPWRRFWLNTLNHWRALPRKNTVLAVTLLAMLVASATTAGIVHISAAHITHSAAQTTNPAHLTLRQLQQRYQQQLAGRKLPTPAQLTAARQRAKKLPVSPLGNRASAGSGPKSGSFNGTWSELGPSPNRSSGFPDTSAIINAVAVDPADTTGNTAWIATDQGGVWSTTNGGTTWTPRTDNQFASSFGSVAVDNLTTPSTIYAGSGTINFANFGSGFGDGIFKSTDGGSTWSIANPNGNWIGLGIAKIAPDPTTEGTLLAALGEVQFGDPTQGGIWRSTDGGATWTHVLSDPTNSFGSSFVDASGGTDVAFDPANHNIAFAVLGDLVSQNATLHTGLYESTDNGVTWTQVTSTVPTGSDVQRGSLGFSHDGTKLYVEMADGDYRDSSGGTIFPFSRPHFGELLGGDLYVGTVNTSTGATTYAAQAVGSTVATDNGFPQYFALACVGVDPTDSTNNTVYLCANDMWLTQDGGATWADTTGSSPSFPAFYHLGMAFKSASSAQHYLVGTDGVWVSTNAPTNPTTYTDLNTVGLSLDELTTGGANGDVGSDSQLYESSFQDGLEQYPVGPLSGAQPWTEEGQFSQHTVVDPTNNANVYVNGGGSSSIFASTDGGATFNPASTGINGSEPSSYLGPLAIAPSNHADLLTGTTRVYRSTNSAGSWTPISPNLDHCSFSCSSNNYWPISTVSFAPTNANVIYAGTENGHLFTSTNGGASWSAGVLVAPNNCYVYGGHTFCGAIASIAVDPTAANVVYAIAYDGQDELYKSTNSGASWTDIGSNLPYFGLNSVTISAANHNLVLVGAYVGAFASPDGGATWDQLGGNLPYATSVQNVYTNPAGTELFAATFGRGLWMMTTPEFGVTPAGLNLTAAPSSTPPSATFALRNDGFGTLNWSLTSSLPAWIASATPTSGSLGMGASQTITVTFNTLGASQTTYSTNLTYTDPAAGNSPFNVPVTIVASNGSTSWYFAEGYTGGNATEYLTIANPNPVTAHVNIKYLLGSGGPVTATPTIPANSRFTQVVNTIVGPNQNVSMVVTADVPIVAERPYYVTYVGTFGTLPSGTDVLGATALSTQFDFANVDSSSGRDTWLTILNNNAGPTPMTVTINYYPQAGGSPITKVHSVPANSRGTVAVQYEAGLPRADYSATITLSEPGLVERTLYEKADPVTGYPGAADVIGVPNPLTTWYFAEGYSSPTVKERYVVSNPSTTLTATVYVTYYLPGGFSLSTPNFTLNPGQQHSFDASAFLGTANVSNSAVVSSIDNPVLAERIMSSIYNGSAGCCYHSIHAPGLSEVLGAANTGQLFDFAEGYTGGQVAEYLTILNPDPVNQADVTVTFLPANGTAPTVENYVINPSTRFTLYTNSILPGVFFSMTVESSIPILAERPMSFIYNGFAPGSTDIIGYQPPGS